MGRTGKVVWIGVLLLWLAATLGRAALSLYLGVVVEEFTLSELMPLHTRLLGWAAAGVVVWTVLTVVGARANRSRRKASS